MSFDFILIAFSSKTPPLLTKKIKKKSITHNFAPLQKDGFAFSADTELWSISSKKINSLYPSKQDLEDWISLSTKNNEFLLMALCKDDKSDLLKIFGKKNNLISWSAFEKNFHPKGFITIGYDVLDSFTGISALVNIGYEDPEYFRIKNLNLIANEYGLLKSENDAEKFLEVVESLAEEHAPYEVVEIRVRLPIQH